MAQRPRFDPTRFLLGGVVAYAVGAPVSFLVVSVVTLHVVDLSMLLGVWFFAMGFYPLALAAVFGGGIVNAAAPALTRFGWFAYVALGALYGAACTLTLVPAGFGSGTVRGNADFFLPDAVAGAVAGLALWGLARSERRRRLTANPA